ncbi:MAG: NUDIX hydrolase [Clostridiales bacterium]|nr:NUDIX hydrolase [Clostridiales bacterium]
MYKRIKRENIFKGKIIDVKVDTVVLPNGREAKREVVLHNDASAIVAEDEQGRLIFVRQYRHPVEKEIIEIPAGICETGEDPKECALRELEEETSYKAGKIVHLTSFQTSAGFSNEVIHIYLCSELTRGSYNFDEDEFLTDCRYTLDEAVNMIFSGEITDSKTIIGVLCYKEYLNRKAEG